MFREMRRKKQQLTNSECETVLQTETRGVLSLIGENGYPYGIPMNHYYCAENGRLYFHCAREGHKIDALKACEKACYTVFDKGYRKDGEWAFNVKSVVIFGTIRLVEDEETTRRICTAICRKFTDDEDYLQWELEHALQRVQCLELTPAHITGKLVKES